MQYRPSQCGWYLRMRFGNQILTSFSMSTLLKRALMILKWHRDGLESLKSEVDQHSMLMSPWCRY
eukprot:5774327-Amphidinium_carterae.1